MIVTPLYAGLLTLLFVLLSLRVVQVRQKGIPLGDGGDPKMLRVIRGHANFAEYVPLALLMMAILELSRCSSYVLHAIGIALILSRILHGYALSYTPRFRFGRTWGAGLTFVILAVEAVLCLWQAFKGMSVT
ncbi:MAG TPA: MAPEG family protein [Burkholderiales bacterium]